MKLIQIFNLKRNAYRNRFRWNFDRIKRKIVWAEGKIRAGRGVILPSGAPNDSSRRQAIEAKKVMIVAIQIEMRS